MEQIFLDPKAAEKVAVFIEDSETATSAFLRIGVKGGGCSGFKYQLALDVERDGDLLFESNGQTIVVDPDSYPYVAGSTIVFKEGEKDGLMRTESGFDVVNPKAVASCGCGSSFRVDTGTGCSVTGEEVTGNEYYL